MSERFDYVIVGAGSAGCIVANKLSSDPGVRVLVLEAGPSARSKEIRIPAAFSKLFKSKFDWGFQTAPQEGLGDRSIYYPRGKTLGGSSAMNATGGRVAPSSARTASKTARPGPRRQRPLRASWASDGTAQ